MKRAFPGPPGRRTIFDADDGTRHPETWLRGWYNAKSLVLDVAECFWIRTPDRKNLALVTRRMELHQSNIMPLVAVSRGPIGGILLVMPLMQAGTIGDLLSTKQYEMDEATVLSIASDVANAMAFFHALHPPIVGKNLKPHHLFLDSSWRTLMGLSFRQPNRQSVWAPPECIRGGPWTKEADVYAFSLLLYTLVHQAVPFEGRKSSDLLEAVRDASEETIRDARPAMEGADDIHDLIRACWAEDPAARPSFLDIREALIAAGGVVTRPRPSFSTACRDGLLKGMFPDRVRALLEAGKPVPSQPHPDVTLFFSDIKGYSDMSRVMQDEAVRTMLDVLYTFMDACAEEHGVHKMETIGDSFFGVTNLAGDQPDHAARMGRFALAVVEGTSRMPVNPQRPDSAMLQMRCGLHTGPVVSGVAGKLNMRYCLYGNAVNIASRMESTGEPNRVQMSRETADAVSKDDRLRERVRRRAGQVDVKGQGKMRTYWLLTDADISLQTRSCGGSTNGERRDSVGLLHGPDGAMWQIREDDTDGGSLETSVDEAGPHTIVIE